MTTNTNAADSNPAGKPDWNGKPYHSLDSRLKEQFGTKVYKLSLDGQMTCPNRDGTIGSRGCIFCSEGGSGEFAAKRADFPSISAQIEAAKKRIAKKTGSGPYIAYFQSFTNTYAPLSRLEPMFTEAIRHPDIAALSIGTRPDCLEPEKIRLLKQLNRIKPVWVELGLQTIHPATAVRIRRGYDLACFEDTVMGLKEAGLTVIVHLILGLPGESREEMLESVKYIGGLTVSGSRLVFSKSKASIPAVDGIKLQLLHILKGTDLAFEYQRHPFPLFSLEEYTDFVITCVEHLPPSMIIHRLTGDGPKSLLIEPAWSGNKRLVLNTLTRRFRERNTWQGRLWSDDNKQKGFYL